LEDTLYDKAWPRAAATSLDVEDFHWVAGCPMSGRNALAATSEVADQKVTVRLVFRSASPVGTMHRET
jgi:hypothetical protein